MKVTIKELKKLIKEAVEEEMDSPKTTPEAFDWAKKLIPTPTFKTSVDALKWAKRFGPSDKSREAASRSPHMAFMYAAEVDKGPHDVTRQGVLSDGSDFVTALKYAREIDKGPHDGTRKNASRFETTAFEYARDVDKKAHPVTRAAIAKNKKYLEKYEELFGEE